MAAALVKREGQNIFKPRERDPGQMVTSLSVEEREEVGMTVFRKVLELTPAEGKVETCDGRWWNPGGI